MIRGACDFLKGPVAAEQSGRCRRGLGGVLPGIDTQFLHARDESRAVDTHAGRGRIRLPQHGCCSRSARTISSRGHAMRAELVMQGLTKGELSLDQVGPR